MKRRSKCTAFLIVALALLLACALLAGCESKVTLKLVTYDGNFTVLELSLIHISEPTRH